MLTVTCWIRKIATVRHFMQVMFFLATIRYFLPYKDLSEAESIISMSFIDFFKNKEITIYIGEYNLPRKIFTLV